MTDDHMSLSTYCQLISMRIAAIAPGRATWNVTTSDKNHTAVYVREQSWEPWVQCAPAPLLGYLSDGCTWDEFCATLNKKRRRMKRK